MVKVMKEMNVKIALQVNIEDSITLITKSFPSQENVLNKTIADLLSLPTMKL